MSLSLSEQEPTSLHVSRGASVHVTAFTPRRIPLCRAIESDWQTLENPPLCGKIYGEEGMNASALVCCILFLGNLNPMFIFCRPNFAK